MTTEIKPPATSPREKCTRKHLLGKKGSVTRPLKICKPAFILLSLPASPPQVLAGQCLSLPLKKKETKKKKRGTKGRRGRRARAPDPNARHGFGREARGSGKVIRMVRKRWRGDAPYFSTVWPLLCIIPHLARARASPEMPCARGDIPPKPKRASARAIHRGLALQEKTNNAEM